MATLPNPFDVQTPTRAGRRPDVPLVLIHDGGGTIVSYTMMGPLNRHVYGIHNPRFYEGGYFEGGFIEMADIYTAMIREIVPSGDLLLGGWSLGGILSIQIAHNLARTAPGLHVLGIVQIDSPCPPKGGWVSNDKSVAGTPAFSSSTNAENRARVDRCMKSSMQMSSGWSLPTWRAGGDIKQDLLPPPVVLIRCRDYAPAPAGSEPGAVVRVDRMRTARTLGWDAYWEEQGFPGAKVLDTEGHHYNVFAPQHLGGITKQVSTAIDILLDREMGLDSADRRAG